MKIDMHTHCLPVSKCAHHQPEEIPEMFIGGGIDAIVLTNHCYPYHCDRLSNDLKEQAKIYVDIYRQCKNSGEQVGLKVFFGVELKLINEPNAPEFLLYGISEEDFIDSYPLFNKTQKELFDFCNEKNILMVQAHPYRGKHHADMQYLHGLEVYNPHPLNDPRFEDTLNLAIQNNKLKTAGSDFHIKQQAGDAGLIIPDYINDQFSLRDYIKSQKAVIFGRNGIIYEDK